MANIVSYIKAICLLVNIAIGITASSVAIATDSVDTITQQSADLEKLPTVETRSVIQALGAVNLASASQQHTELTDFDRHPMLEHQLVAWQPVTHNTLELGWNSHSTWLRQRFSNTSDRPSLLYLEAAIQMPQNLSAYQVDHSGQVQALSTSSIRHHKPLVALQLAPGETTTVYWHIRHIGDLRMALYAWNPKLFYHQQSQQQLVYGINYGASLVVTLVSLFLFFASRRSSYVYLSAFAFSSLLMVFQFEGHLYQFVPVPPELRVSFYMLCLFMFQLSLGLFSRSFLSLRSWSKTTNKALLLAIVLVCLSSIISAAVPQSLFVQQISQLFNYLFLTFIIIVSMYIFKKGYPNGLLLAVACIAATMGLSNSQSYFQFIDYPLYAISPTANAFAACHFILLAASLFAFYQAHKEQLKGVRELVRLTEEKLLLNAESHHQKLQQVIQAKDNDTARIEQKAKSRFLTAISHEVRTPMSGILGMSELLADTPLNKQQKHYLEAIHDSSQTLLTVINELLDFSQIESGAIELECQPFNLQSMVDDCIAVFALKTEEHQTPFKAAVQPGTPLEFKGDSVKLKQILLNLLQMSSEIATGGEIDLYVSQTSRSSVNSHELVFRITRSYESINQDDLETLNSLLNTQNMDNTGFDNRTIVLTLAREIIEHMHGQLQFKQRDEAIELNFSVRLPITLGEDETIEIEQPWLNGKQLLVFDDDKHLLDQLNSIATAWHLELVIIHNWQELRNLPSDALNNYLALLLSCEKIAPQLLMGIPETIPVIMIEHSSQSTSPADLPEHVNYYCSLQAPLTAHDLQHALVRIREHLESCSPSTSQDKLSERTLNVLVAEDNPVNRLALLGQLKKLGLKPDAAEDGLQAVDAVKQSAYDLILMDCEMPKLNGYDATTEIRQWESGHGRHPAQIIALSAHADQEHKAKALNAGMDLFLSKPIKLDQIKELLKRNIFDG